MSSTLDPNREPNDPTRSGPPVITGQGAQLSQNEIEQLCLKAARGAGMSWGLAEEAGFAAGWLAMRGLDGPGALLAQLQGADGKAWHEICPVVRSGRFQAAEGGILCPIALGAALCDFAGQPETAMQDAALQIGPVNHPILLLPFLADLARVLGTNLGLTWAEGHVQVTRDGRISGDAGQLADERRLSGDLSVQSALSEAPMRPGAPLFVPASTLRDLNTFALRTTVPASDASRAGAGAAANDND